TCTECDTPEYDPRARMREFEFSPSLAQHVTRVIRSSPPANSSGHRVLVSTPVVTTPTEPSRLRHAQSADIDAAQKARVECVPERQGRGIAACKRPYLSPGAVSRTRSGQNIPLPVAVEVDSGNSNSAGKCHQVGEEIANYVGVNSTVNRDFRRPAGSARSDDVH